jgi:ABC-type transport system involved in multi-copper enzyme maturation permease subunit
VQFLLRLGYIYVLVNTEFLKALRVNPTYLPPIDAYFFKNMIDVQLLFCFVFAFLLGAGLISKDLRHSALVLYFSKPITRWQYFLGKFLSLFALFMVLTWLQGAILFVVQTAVAPDHSDWHLYFWSSHVRILGAMTLYATAVSVTVSLLILTASSLTKNSRYAGTTFAIYIIGAGIVSGILVEKLGVQAFGVLSPLRVIVDLGNNIFHIEREGAGASVLRNLPHAHEALGPFWAWAGVLGNCALCAGILKWRLDRAARYGR